MVSLEEMQEQQQFTGKEIVCCSSAVSNAEISPSKAPETECPSPYAESMHQSDVDVEFTPKDTYDDDSDAEHYLHEMHSDFEKFDDAPKEDKEVADVVESTVQSGYLMGQVLANVLDSPCEHDEPPFVELAVSGEQLKYVHYMNKQVLEVNSKKFFRLANWETPLLYGYKHFAGIYNTVDKRGYIGYCQLRKCVPPDLPTTSVERYILIEIWQTRCWNPHYHIVVYDKVSEDIQLKLHGLNWLKNEKLECDPGAKFDLEKVRE